MAARRQPCSACSSRPCMHSSWSGVLGRVLLRRLNCCRRAGSRVTARRSAWPPSRDCAVRASDRLRGCPARRAFRGAAPPPGRPAAAAPCRPARPCAPPGSRPAAPRTAHSVKRTSAESCAAVIRKRMWVFARQQRRFAKAFAGAGNAYKGPRPVRLRPLGTYLALREQANKNAAGRPGSTSTLPLGRSRAPRGPMPCSAFEIRSGERAGLAQFCGDLLQAGSTRSPLVSSPSVISPVSTST